MMKRTLFLLVALIMVLTLAGCSTKSTVPDEAGMEVSGFKQIDGKESLVYSTETRCVYYMFSTSSIMVDVGYGYGYMAPYISENGKFCRYINDEIVEITEENTDN